MPSQKRPPSGMIRFPTVATESTAQDLNVVSHWTWTPVGRMPIAKRLTRGRSSPSPAPPPRLEAPSTRA